MQSITNAAGVEKHFSTRSILRCLQYTVLPPEVTDSRGPLKPLIEQSSGNCKHCRMIHALRGESTITQRQTARLPHFELADLDHSLCLSVYRHNASFLGITGGSGSDCASRSGGFSKRVLRASFDSRPPCFCSSLVPHYRQLQRTAKRQRNTAQTLLKLLGDAQAALRRGSHVWSELVST